VAPCWGAAGASTCHTHDVWPPKHAAAQGLNYASPAGLGESAVPAFPEYPPLRFSPSVAPRPDAPVPAAVHKQLRFYKRRVSILERQDRDSKRSILRLRTENARLRALVQAAQATYPVLRDAQVQSSPVSSLALYNTSPAENPSPAPSQGASPSAAFPQYPRSIQQAHSSWYSSPYPTNQPLQLAQQQPQQQQASAAHPAAWTSPAAQQQASGGGFQGIGGFHELQRLDAFLQAGGTPPVPQGSSPAGSVQVHDQTSARATPGPAAVAHQAALAAAAVRPAASAAAAAAGAPRTSTPQTGTPAAARTHAAGHVTPSVAGVLAGQLHGPQRGGHAMQESPHERVGADCCRISVSVPHHAVSATGGVCETTLGQMGRMGTPLPISCDVGWGAVQHLRSRVCRCSASLATLASRSQRPLPCTVSRSAARGPRQVCTLALLQPCEKHCCVSSAVSKLNETAS
jgi:hypothetical protein